MSATNVGWQYSGLVVADQCLIVGPCTLGGVALTGNGTNVATVVIYDDTGVPSAGQLANRTVLRLVGSATNPNACFMVPDRYGLAITRGVYVDLNGTGAQAVVYYSGAEEMPTPTPT